MKIARLNSPPREVAPDETDAVASKSKSVELRLLMKEREDVASRLVALDYRIWALEEIYRRALVKVPISSSGTSVPQGSLTSQGGKPQR